MEISGAAFLPTRFVQNIILSKDEKQGKKSIGPTILRNEDFTDQLGQLSETRNTRVSLYVSKGRWKHGALTIYPFDLESSAGLEFSDTQGRKPG